MLYTSIRCKAIMVRKKHFKLMQIAFFKALEQTVYLFHTKIHDSFENQNLHACQSSSCLGNFNLRHNTSDHSNSINCPSKFISLSVYASPQCLNSSKISWNTYSLISHLIPIYSHWYISPA